MFGNSLYELGLHSEGSIRVFYDDGVVFAVVVGKAELYDRLEGHVELEFASLGYARQCHCNRVYGELVEVVLVDGNHETLFSTSAEVELGNIGRCVLRLND